MFTPSGESTAAVDAMQLAWTGQLPPNQAPVVTTMRLNNHTPNNNVTLEAGEHYRAEITANDPDGDPLTYSWHLKPESTATTDGGDYEPPIPNIPGLIDNPTSPTIHLAGPCTRNLPPVRLRPRQPRPHSPRQHPLPHKGPWHIYRKDDPKSSRKVTARPQTFRTGDGWFIYNLVTNLASNAG